MKAICLAASAVVLTVCAAQARPHAGGGFGNVTQFCGDRVCGWTGGNWGLNRVLTRRAGGHPHQDRANRVRAARHRGRPRLAHHSEDGAVQAIPLPRPMPEEGIAPGAVWATVARSTQPATNLLEAFKREVVEAFQPVRPGFVAIRTRSGRRAVVAQAYAWRFAGFLRDLEATGYRIRDIGGYVYRRIAGTARLSKHAFGMAIDVNQVARNVVTVPMPAGVSRMAARWGLKSGGDWRDADLGHFEVADRRPGKTRLAWLK